MGLTGPENNSMTEQLREQIERLRSVAPKLNAATEEAARVLQEVEKFLGEVLSLGISATSSDFHEEPADPSDAGDERIIVYRLAYDRLHGKFQFHTLEQTQEPN